MEMQAVPPGAKLDIGLLVIGVITLNLVVMSEPNRGDESLGV